MTESHAGPALPVAARLQIRHATLRDRCDRFSRLREEVLDRRAADGFLICASIAVFSGKVPLKALSSVERIDLGMMLFVAPIVALVLAASGVAH